MYLPLGLNATDEMDSLWPTNVLISCPVSLFHILTVLSSLPDRMNLPKGLIATEEIDPL